MASDGGAGVSGPMVVSGVAPGAQPGKRSRLPSRAVAGGPLRNTLITTSSVPLARSDPATAACAKAAHGAAFPGCSVGSTSCLTRHFPLLPVLPQHGLCHSPASSATGAFSHFNPGPSTHFQCDFHAPFLHFLYVSFILSLPTNMMRCCIIVSGKRALALFLSFSSFAESLLAAPEFRSVGTQPDGSLDRSRLTIMVL